MKSNLRRSGYGLLICSIASVYALSAGCSGGGDSTTFQPVVNGVSVAPSPVLDRSFRSSFTLDDSRVAKVDLTTDSATAIGTLTLPATRAENARVCELRGTWNAAEESVDAFGTLRENGAETPVRVRGKIGTTQAQLFLRDRPHNGRSERFARMGGGGGASGGALAGGGSTVGSVGGGNGVGGNATGGAPPNGWLPIYPPSEQPGPRPQPDSGSGEVRFSDVVPEGTAADVSPFSAIEVKISRGGELVSLYGSEGTDKRSIGIIVQVRDGNIAVGVPYPMVALEEQRSSGLPHANVSLGRFVPPSSNPLDTGQHQAISGTVIFEKIEEREIRLRFENVRVQPWPLFGSESGRNRFTMNGWLSVDPRNMLR